MQQRVLLFAFEILHNRTFIAVLGKEFYTTI